MNSSSCFDTMSWDGSFLKIAQTFYLKLHTSESYLKLLLKVFAFPDKKRS